jgi:hypothetical protein
MSNDNLYLSLIFIHQRHQLYIGKHSLQAAIDKEDCRSIAVASTIQPNYGSRL